MKKMTKICTTLLAGAMLVGCNTNSSSSSSGSSGSRNIGKLDISETLDQVTIENSDIKIIFDKTNGSMLSFTNTVTGNDYIKSTVGGNWAMLVNTKTDDVFEAKPSDSSNSLITSRNQEATYKKDVAMDSLTLSFAYDIEMPNSNGSIEVNNVIVMKKDEQDISFKYDVKNKMNKGVIISFTGAQLTGLKSNEKEWNLFWPSYEGKIYANSIERSKNNELNKLSMVYPVPSSVQLMQLYDNNESIYYFVKDTTREYKELNFGPFISTREYDNGAVETVDKVSMSITQYPYIAKNEEKNVFETIIGVSQYGDYYSGSRKYASFLEESNMVKTKTQYAREFTGYTPLIMDREDSKDFATYVTPTRDLTKTTITDYIDKFNDLGINAINLLGWHEGGFDHMYPDYKFKPENDGNGYGENNFKVAMGNLHADGKKAFAYINAHIADVESEWSTTIYDQETGRTNIERAAIKNKRYTLASEELETANYVNTMLQENYGTTTYYYAMCPASKLFQDAILSAISRLAKAGIDGIWLDQLMQMPANLCFDPTHGHKTPATAYGEGYSYMLSKMEEIFISEGIEDAFFSAEGVCDAYVKWVDACGYLWSRPFGALDMGDNTNYVPETTRLSIPAIFLGQDGAGAYTHDNDEFAKAFTMFDPFLVSDELNKVSQFTSLYMNDEAYLNGQYIGKTGITCTNEDIEFGASIAKNGKKIIINIYNFSTSQNSAEMHIDLQRIGVTGSIKNLSVALGNEEQFSLSENKVTIKNLNERQVCSIKLTIGE